jgi:hypothetical protein
VILLVTNVIINVISPGHSFPTPGHSMNVPGHSTNVPGHSLVGPKFIDKNKILSKHQYGFRKNRSTEHAIIDFVDKITKAIDEGKYSVGIFLDLSKAFDTINHRILIKKLEHYGIRGVPKKWFENYLCQ